MPPIPAKSSQDSRSVPGQPSLPRPRIPRIGQDLAGSRALSRCWAAPRHPLAHQSLVKILPNHKILKILADSQAMFYFWLFNDYSRSNKMRKQREKAGDVARSRAQDRQRERERGELARDSGLIEFWNYATLPPRKGEHRYCTNYSKQYVGCHG